MTGQSLEGSLEVVSISSLFDGWTTTSQTLKYNAAKLLKEDSDLGQSLFRSRATLKEYACLISTCHADLVYAQRRLYPEFYEHNPLNTPPVVRPTFTLTPSEHFMWYTSPSPTEARDSPNPYHSGPREFIC